MTEAGATRPGPTEAGPSRASATWPGLPESGLTGKLVRQLCGTVLIMEAVVLALAIAPAVALEHLSASLAGGVCGALALCALVLGGLVGRRAWAFWAGSVLQALVIAAGVLVPAMYALGGIFAALWIAGILLARRLQGLSPLPGPAEPPSAEPPASSTPAPGASSSPAS